jgi:cobalt/nickel transport protein
MTPFQKKLWIGIGVLAVLSPLGLIIPEWLKAGSAWGEWDAETIKEMVGFVPKGLEKLSGLWNPPLPDYGFGGEGAAPWVQYGAYILSGVVGILLAWAVWLLIKKTLLKNLENAR